MHNNNPFDLPASVLSNTRPDVKNTSLGRMDAMVEKLSPAHQTDDKILSALNANLELLYIKAKNFHWNVKGVGFQGVHEMFDKIQEYATESADRVAERMRYYNMPVCACAKAFLDQAWFPEGDSMLEQNGMLSDMSLTLQCIHDHLLEDMDKISCPVSQNMMQDICEQLDKFNYFVKSNMSSYPNTSESTASVSTPY